ncbi:hypothetical protein EVAR_43533_1 [Eumeta japonica]|uniref:Uncharacterized protein n=1 Tax=Eumeta variegata TaxID=151549 RepID=A0A4C1WBI1_EUMVA|nr:hypothetical protein EVAR_43533_1 [Eumeta japonica]
MATLEPASGGSQAAASGERGLTRTFPNKWQPRVRVLALGNLATLNGRSAEANKRDDVNKSDVRFNEEIAVRTLDVEETLAFQYNASHKSNHPQVRSTSQSKFKGPHRDHIPPFYLCPRSLPEAPHGRRVRGGVGPLIGRAIRDARTREGGRARRTALLYASAARNGQSAYSRRRRNTLSTPSSETKFWSALRPPLVSQCKK